MLYMQQLGPTTYGANSRKHLKTCHPDLQRIFRELANDGWDISATCGGRGKTEQTQAYVDGVSNAPWPKSKHNITHKRPVSEAIDVAPYIPGFSYLEIADTDTPWIILAGAVMQKANELNIKIRWGGLFTGLKDLGHFELVNV